MTIRKTLAALAAVGLLSSSSVVIAQTAGTSLDGTSNGVQGTPGQQTPSNPMPSQAGKVTPNGAVTDATGANAQGETAVTPSSRGGK